jgi:hypothetical protein
MSEQVDTSGWPIEMMNALRLSVEVAGGGPGRRAFVDITPFPEPADMQAERED